MKRLSSFFCLVFLFTPSVFPQTAKMVDKLGDYFCGDNYRFDKLYQDEIKDKPQNKIYIIHYEGPREIVLGHNKKTQKLETKIENPRFGSAANISREIPLYLKMVHNVPDNRVVLIDGGYRERFVMEIWSVPEGAEAPKAMPTLTRKDIKFAKGKPRRTRQMACCYESC